MSWTQWQQSAPGAIPAVINPNPGAIPPLINPAPPVVPPNMQPYSQEQWSQLQQQNWHQWAQWQQQYQQWHQQYGAEYQKSINALAAQTQQAAIPPLTPNMAVPPPLPVEATKPPLPLDDPPPPPSTNYSTAPSFNYTTQPPPPTKGNWSQQQYSTNSQQPSRFDHTNKRRYDNQIDYDNKKKQYNQPNHQKSQLQQQQNYPKSGFLVIKENPDELSEAEKKFDKQFAEWEAQFNSWKEQNAEHPDKEQFREYEKKWEQWRAQLLERREQMKKKRLDNTKLQSQNYNQPPVKYNDTKQTSPVSLISEPFSRPPPHINDEPLNFRSNNESAFLKPSFNDGIPGLDLVKDTEVINQNKKDDDVDDKLPEKKGLDFDAISKGINTILGDPKLMDMLSMVSSQQNPMKPNDNLVNTTVIRIKDNTCSNTNSNINFNNEQLSNQSCDEHSNHSVEQREQINNFDDQTRSSFTLHEHYESGNINNSNGNSFRSQNQRFSNFEKSNNFHNRNFSNDECQLNSGTNENLNRFGTFGSNHPLFSETFCDNPHFDDQKQFGIERPFGQYNNENKRQFSGNNVNQPTNYENRVDKRFINEQIINTTANNFNNKTVTNFTRTSFNDESLNYDRYYQENNEVHNYDNYGASKKNYEGKNIENVENAVPPPPPNIEPDILKPVTIVDYEHKSLKSAEPEILIEPIHMFDYRHKTLSRIPFPQRPKWLSETVKNIHEFDPPLVRPYDNLRRYPTSMDNWNSRRNFNERPHFDERRPPPSQFDDRRSMPPPFEINFDERKRISSNDRSSSFDEKRQRLSIPEEHNRRLDEHQHHHQQQQQQQQNKQETNFINTIGTNNKTNITQQNNKNATLIEDLINPPGRYNRPPRIVIILRGPPGSGKTFLAKLIKDKEVENGGSAPRILSLDDYFMVETDKEVIEEGKKVKIKEMVFEYESEMEENYRLSLIKSFKKTITDGFFNFVIVDNVNDKIKYFGEMWSYAKQNGFQVYVCQMDLDLQLCTKRNIHGRTEKDIEKCIANWEPTPTHHPILDATSLIQSGSIPEVEMEEVNSPETQLDDIGDDDISVVIVNNNDDEEDDEDNELQEDQVARSKWDNFDCSLDNLAKLDGVSKPLRPSRTMEEYLQLGTEWTTSTKPLRPGEKRVRWADLEEQKQQEKMRAIGFVVGQTDWHRMMDPSMGSSALTQTKYIERVGRY